jgi:hypothetical protein
MVGLPGLEPGTFGPPDRRANQAAPQPVATAVRCQAAMLSAAIGSPTVRRLAAEDLTGLGKETTGLETQNRGWVQLTRETPGEVAEPMAVAGWADSSVVSSIFSLSTTTGAPDVQNVELFPCT